MQNQLIEAVEAKSRKQQTPAFEIGDTVDVSVKIVEGEKERVQVFSGTVIARKGSGLNESVTVRRIVNDEGVERVFPIHAPTVLDIQVKRHGQTRRAKLYYLRERVGKAVRLKERRGAAAPAPATKAAKGKKAAAKAE
ncbi:MAG: 50S ribosomal protein L19 [Phycisphaerae bacterium]|nr:50S ribosomal protein L19 [Phycisphaerae bacterium]